MHMCSTQVLILGLHTTTIDTYVIMIYLDYPPDHLHRQETRRFSKFDTWISRYYNTYSLLYSVGIIDRTLKPALLFIRISGDWPRNSEDFKWSCVFLIGYSFKNEEWYIKLMFNWCWLVEVWLRSAKVKANRRCWWRVGQTQRSYAVGMKPNDQVQSNKLKIWMILRGWKWWMFHHVAWAPAELGAVGEWFTLLG